MISVNGAGFPGTGSMNRLDNAKDKRFGFGSGAVSSLLITALYTCSAMADMRLEEVVVTAQKREQNLQQVPISISAISRAQLEYRGIESGVDLTGLAPNLMVSKAPGSSLISQVSIRGSATGQPGIYVDPAVGMYVDGVYIAKSQGSLFELLDLERVEVLRGPQGTLFGRNTLAGAINFVTRKPSGEWSGSASLEIGNYQRHVERVSVDLPRMGILSLNLAARNEQSDGWLRNTTGKDQGDAGRKAWRLAATFDITPEFQIDYSYDHSEVDEAQSPTTLYSLSGTSGPLTALGSQLVGLGSSLNNPNFTAAGNFLLAAAPQMAPHVRRSRPSSISTNPWAENGQWLDIDGHAVTASYATNPNNTLKYIGSYRSMDLKNRYDLDGTPVDLINTGLNTDMRSYSHELQWVGNLNSLNYVLGYYYYKEDGSTTGGQHIAMSPPPANDKLVVYDVGDRAEAVYGQLDWSVTEDLTLTAGLRYTRERRTNASAQIATDGYRGPAVSYILPWTRADASFSASTPTVSVNYQVLPDINLYARMAKGFKSGGFSAEMPTVEGVTTPYGPEKSTTYELGVKSVFLDQRAQLNIALYHNEITDMQISQLPPGSTTSQFFNAGEATQQGVEVEGVFLPAPGWQLRLNYGYVDAEFDEYMDHPRNAATAALAGASVNDLIDTADNRVMPYAPRHTFDLSVDGELAQTRWGILRLLASYTYRSSFYVAPANKSLHTAEAGSGSLASLNEVPSLGLVDMKLLLSDIPVTQSGTAEVAIWVKNLTDEDKLANLIDFGFFQNATWTDPRTYGLSLAYKW